jgi:hypothetical protein
MNEEKPFNRPQDVEYVPPGALEAISRAEIDIAIATARKYSMHSPDKLVKVKQDMIAYATLDQETAEGCFYSLPRGGKTIQGPSIRLAEIAVVCYGNLRAATRVINTVLGTDDPHVVVQSVVMDMERNITIGIEKRRRIVKKKSKDRIDEDDINLATNACSAIAFRDSVFKIIPGALIKPVYEQAKQVAIGDAKTLGQRRAKCLETFGKMGITAERVLLKIEKKNVEEITIEDLEMLLGLRNAIKEGEVSLDEAFPVIPKEDKTKPAATGHQQATAAQTSTASTTVPKQDKKEEDNVPMDGKTPLAKAADAPTAAATPPEATQTPSEAQTPNAPTAAQSGATESPAATPQAEVDPYFEPKTGDTDAVLSVKLLAKQNALSWAQLKAYLQSKQLMRKEQSQLSELASSKLEAIGRSLHKWIPDIKAMKV